MSSTSLATALVVPFEQLRMTDVEAVGGKNASLGEMISQLAATGVRVPGGFATTAHAFREFLEHDELAERINARLATLNTDDVRALAEAGAEIRALDHRGAVPADARSGDPRGVRHACPPATREASFAVRSSATAEDLPDASFAGQQETFLNVVRHRRRAAQDEGGVRLAVQRPRHQLSRAQGLRARRRGAVGRRAAHGALRPRRRRRDVHHRHRVGLRRRGVHHLQLRPGRDGGAGRREPRRVLRAQADAARRQAADHPPQPGLQADQRMEFAIAAGRGRQRQAGEDRRHAARAAQPLFADRCRRASSWRATRWSSSSTTAGRWTSSGARTAPTASSTSCRRAPKR